MGAEMKLKRVFLRILRDCWRIIKYSYTRYVNDQLAYMSIALTYYTLFSIVPLLALIFGITRGFQLNFPLLEMLTERFPAHQEFFVRVCELAQNTLKEASSGLVAGIGVIALLWTVVWLINNIEKAFNVVWGLPSSRNIFRKFSSYISLILFTPVMMVAVNTIGVMARDHLNEVSHEVSSGVLTRFLWLAIVWLLPILANILLIFVVYMRVPNTKVRWGGALVSAILIGFAFQLLQDAFIFLQSWVFSYNRIYGGFAVLPLFLIWINWSWQLILFGAELCFVYQHLKSGVFNETRRKISVRLKLEHQLAIVRLVYRNFNDSCGPVAEAEVASALCVPAVELQAEIKELIDCGILCRTTAYSGDFFLLPGIPPDKLTVVEFLRIVNGSGDNETIELARFERLFGEMEVNIEKSSLNKKVYEV